jgi:hypothetical protein
MTAVTGTITLSAFARICLIGNPRSTKIKMVISKLLNTTYVDASIREEIANRQLAAYRSRSLILFGTKFFCFSNS